MRFLDLDFRREHRQARWAGMLVLAVGLAGAVASGVQYLRVSEELVKAEATIRESGDAARKQTAAPRSGGRQPAALEVKHANDILHQLNLPWDELFASVESARTADVALLNIESDIDNARIKFSGEARNLESILDYARSLKTQPRLADVYLQSHEIQQQDPQHPVRFVMTANWLARK